MSLSSNHVAWFFNHQYIWKESMDTISILSLFFYIFSWGTHLIITCLPCLCSFWKKLYSELHFLKSSLIQNFKSFIHFSLFMSERSALIGVASLWMLQFFKAMIQSKFGQQLDITYWNRSSRILWILLMVTLLWSYLGWWN